MPAPVTVWTSPALGSTSVDDWHNAPEGDTIRPLDIASMFIQTIAAYDAAYGHEIAEMVNRKTTWTEVP